MKQTRSFQGGQVKVSVDTDKIEELAAALSVKYKAQVGILGDKTNRAMRIPGETASQYKKRVKQYKYSSSDKDEMTNAEIGLIHEKGSYSRNIPRRSFLEVPLTKHLEAFASLGKSFKVALEANQVNLKKVYSDLGIIAEQVVQKAFTSSGDGSWAPLKRRKGMPLIDTAQLRRSITSRVVST